MTPSLTEDFKTLEELQTQASVIVDQIHRTGRPVVITVKGKPDVVMLDAASYERREQANNLRALLAEGEDDIRAGRTRPLEEFLDELSRAKKIPRRSRPKGRK